MIELYPHQQLAVEKIRSGCILKGGVGSGKSITALYYYFVKECDGIVHHGEPSKLRAPRHLYIITTARKRDSHEWERELCRFNLTEVTIDSWNNIGKYTSVCSAFFIFDEHKAIGQGKWAKSFIQIAKKNHWVILSATPGDAWIDYVPVFIANGYYKNRSEFMREHVVFKPYVKFPMIDRYVNVQKLINIRDQVLVEMRFTKMTERHDVIIPVGYSKSVYSQVMRERKNIFVDGAPPIQNISEFCSVLRKIVNSSENRIVAVRKLIRENPRLLIFYNFDYELDILRQVCFEEGVYTAEWNGHKHMDVPTVEGPWVYLLQYTASSEAWECTSTNTVCFFSLSYSYKTMEQSKGRIDRLNTPFQDLYYYFLVSDASLDRRIQMSLNGKKDFNEGKFAGRYFE